MVEHGGTSWHQTSRGVSILITIYLSLFVFVMVLSKFLHDLPRLGSILPEAALVILVGMLAGLIIDSVAGDVQADGVADDVARSMLSFSPSIFFVVLLPPIIFNSGYHLRRDLFFRNIVPICMYACIGTAVCTMVVASILYVCVPLFGFGFRPTFLELAAFGALISATDPVSTLAVFQSKKVDPHLFYLVFGESVINDAVGLVLFECLAHLIEKQQNQLNVGQEFAQFLYDFSTGFLGSLVLGTLFAIAYALLMKHVDMGKTPFLELCVYITMMYFPFVAAEILRLSGIVTVLFTGIASKRYVEPNVCAETAINADIVFRLVAHLTETIIFLDLGLSVFGLVGDGAFRIVFIAFALLACLVGRAVNIYPITYLFNMVAGRSKTIPPPTIGNEYVAEGTSREDGVILTSPGESMTDDSVIPWKTAHMLWFSGLRGAVSYGLARMFPQTENQSIFIATTMFIVLTTTFVLGGATESALQFLNIDTGVDEVKYLKHLKKKKLLFGWLSHFEDQTLRSWVLRDFDKRKLDDDGEIVEDIEEKLCYQEHIELTETEHAQVRERKGGLYDYGQ